MKKTSYRTVNLEDGRPTLAEALTRLESEIKYSKALKTGIIKLIHGYGSSGKGGRLKNGVRARLSELKESGAVAFYVKGEDFSIFNAETVRLLDECDELRRERDLNRGNHGVTFVRLK
ncbi:MAG: hypothetical protein IKD89_01760 [Clostridia bacterium]|nr:hypothetical protein [Clostridia bacterium]